MSVRDELAKYDIQSDLQIDRNQLELEWLRQPGLFYRYGRLSAMASAEADLQKRNIDIVHAEVSAEVRDNPAQFGLDKITIPGVEAVIETDETYRQAVEDYIEAKKLSDLLSITVRSFDQRRKALEGLVDLMRMQYFGESVPHDSAGTFGAQAEEVGKEEARDAIRERLANSEVSGRRRRRS